MRVKRWVIVLFGGVVLTSLATAMGLAWLYRNYTVPGQFSQVVYYATLQFIDHPYRELLVIIPGGAFIVWGILQLSRSITAPLMESRANEGGLAKIIETHRLGERDPKLNIVTIGGGTGLSTLLRGIKHEPVRITAIVTAGDDGGSSGRLRTEFNVPAPGDIRNCLVALADSETLLGDLSSIASIRRTPASTATRSGNLFITALTKVSGSFEQAIIESGRVLNIRGAVYPSSLENIVVGLKWPTGRCCRETTIVNARERINRVFLDPSSAEAYLPAVKAILEADLVVLGPGSLYTSVIPNLLVEGIAHALRHTPAETVYVCNVATQPGETDHYDVADHVRGIHRHLGDLPIDRIIVNSNLEPSEAGIKPEWGVSAVEFSGLDEFESRLVVEPRDVVNPDFPLRHDPQKLAKVLVELAQRTTIGPPRQRQYRDMSPTGQALNGHAVSVTPNGHAKHIETTP
ncbi:MAG: YvcK family protein [Thermomicrobiales bacterium]